MRSQIKLKGFKHGLARTASREDQTEPGHLGSRRQNSGNQDQVSKHMRTNTVTKTLFPPQKETVQLISARELGRHVLPTRHLGKSSDIKPFLAIFTGVAVKL